MTGSSDHSETSLGMESESVRRKHLGHLFIECMLQRPDAVCQIDAATGQQETKASVLSRSMQLAKCFRKFGLKPGDVLSLGGRNHLDLHIPYYAALLNGLPISGVDSHFKFDEIKSLLTITKPKIAFCQQESYDYYTRAINDIGLDTKIVTFDGQDNNLTQFIESYNDTNEFQLADFDTSKVYAYLVSTSGTTGTGIKAAAFRHEVVIEKLELLKRIFVNKGNEANELKEIMLDLTPVHSVSSILHALVLPYRNQVQLQTSKPDDVGHIIEVINKYKPHRFLLNPTLASALVQRKNEVDFTCFRWITLGGSKIHPDLKRQLKLLLNKDAQLTQMYGLTELFGPVTYTTPDSPEGSCGVLLPPNEIKLVDPDTGKDITEPHVTGELWVKGPNFTEYYNDPEITEATFSEDGFFKTGDLLYRDENNQFYFVERLKLLFKSWNRQVLPAEVEEVILTHPSVLAACVCGVAQSHDGERPAACVQLNPGCHATEQEIKDLVAGKLSEKKQLRGGVVFVDEMPMTSTGKIAMGKVRQLLNSHQNQSP